MKGIISFLFLFVLYPINNDVIGAKRNLVDKAPEFFVLEWKEGTVLTPVKTDYFVDLSSGDKQRIYVLVDKDDSPQLYTSDISTPVCADGECKFMKFKIYWTLLGEYAGFDRYHDAPLTKHDHDEFMQEDYLKLHQLLIDDKSLLGRRSINQLVEKPKKRTVNGVDAISGATIARVKESVVSGALYSCYTAWHLVHGSIREILKKHTLSILNDKMTLQMLYSSNADYHLYTLQNLNAQEFAKHYKQIVTIFKESSPLVRSIIAKKLTAKLKDEAELQRPFWDSFGSIDNGTKSLMIKNLDSAPNLAKTILSRNLELMSKNQLRAFLAKFKDAEILNKEIQANLVKYANSKNETYSYLAKNFLEERNSQH